MKKEYYINFLSFLSTARYMLQNPLSECSKVTKFQQKIRKDQEKAKLYFEFPRRFQSISQVNEITILVVSRQLFNLRAINIQSH